MSIDNPNDGQTGKIEVRAPAGMRFRITSSNGGLMTSGVGNTTIELPQGLYEIVWSSAERRERQLLRVRSKSSPAIAEFPQSDYSMGLESSLSNEQERLEKFRSELPSKRDYGSAIAIIIEGGFNRDGTRQQFDLEPTVKDIRLLNSKNKAMRADHDRGVNVDLIEGGYSRFYAVRPGDYLISYPAFSGETIQQTVPALPGRTTLVFLQVKKGHILLSSKKEFEQHESQGVRPSQTTILSIDEDDEAYRIRERSRLAMALLNDLAARRTSLDPEFRRILNEAKTDPLLRLLGAAVVVHRLKSGLMPFPDQASQSDQEARKLEASRGWDAAYDWLRFDKGVRLSSDETALKWQLSALGLGKRRVQYAKRIDSPPMLSQSWRWAVEHSVKHPDSMMPNMASVAAARSLNEFGPWLYWKAAAFKAAPAPEVAEVQSLDELAEQVREKAERLSGLKVQWHEARETELPSQPLPSSNIFEGASSYLPASTQIAVGEFSSASAQLVKGAIRLVEKTSNPMDVAMRLGLPGDALPRRLHQVGKELDTLIAAYEHGKDDSTDDEIPPAMFEPITYPDDLNRDRFGGEARRDGYALTASFERTKRRKWTKINLNVTGPGNDGDMVHYFLHDSFHQPERSARFTSGEASLSVTAWGGFTVGVWIPGARTQLELNLAKVPGAPHNIRTL